ncbi:MAG: HD domain-containing protein [Firmicutes bacterium]|nr:HD domain-containing protein [Bacillota bacterium]
MKKIPSSGKFYLAVISLLTLFFLWKLYPEYDMNLTTALGVALFLMVGIYLGLHPIKIATTRNLVDLSDISIYATLFLFGKEWCVWTAFLTWSICQIVVFVRGKIHRERWQLILSNVSIAVLSFVATAYVYEFISSNGAPFDSWINIAAVAASTVVCNLAYLVLSILFLTFMGRRSLHDSFKLIPSILKFNVFFLLSPMGALFAYFYAHEPLGLLLIVFPIWLIYFASQSYSHTLREAQEMITGLSDLLDARDKYTSLHSLRVAEFAQAIAGEMNLGEFSSTEIYETGRIHDLGKIAIEDSVLFKEGTLSKEEWEKMKSHPGLINVILGKFNYLKAKTFVASLHHERFDGKGYPEGKEGIQIPLGSRILAVADAFDAMTSDRPYRKGIPVDVAVQRLKEGKSAQFDPVVVDAMVSYLQKKYADSFEKGQYMAESLMKNVTQQDAYTKEKAEKMMVLVEKICEKLWLSIADIDTLKEAAKLQDIGKIIMDNETLRKKGTLTEKELEKIRDHPVISSKLASSMSVSDEAVKLIRNHHEKYDGTGYPDGLKGEAIPLGARILAVADAYTAMTIDRPFQQSLSKEEALKRIKEGSGTQFDPAIIDVLITVMNNEKNNS